MENMLKHVEESSDTSGRTATGKITTGSLWPALVELALLAIAAPLLYFPDRVVSQVAKFCGCDTGWLTGVGVALVLLLWPVRRWLTGHWVAPLPGAWALWFWFLVTLPVAIWAAPPPLREQYAWPRSLILFWNFNLFWSVLVHASRQRAALGWALVGWFGAVLGIALLAPFGMEPRTKLPVIGTIQGLFPRPLMGLFAGAESGFSTNQVAGTLLYVLPLMIALCVAGLRVRVRGWRWWLLLLSTGWIGVTLVLSQSRGGLLGLFFGLVTLLLLVRRWGWVVLAGLAVMVAMLVANLPDALLDVIADAPAIGALGGVTTVSNFRTAVWDAANQALSDFLFTGIGLGTFRGLVHWLYPMADIPATYDLAHAHNFFLQTALDFGVPGLAAILVVYIAALVQLVRLAYLPTQRAIWPAVPFITPRVLAIGWMGCLVGQSMYSLFDVVAMGSKPNFVWWWWLALIFATANWVLRRERAAETEDAHAETSLAAAPPRDKLRRRERDVRGG